MRQQAWGIELNLRQADARIGDVIRSPSHVLEQEKKEVDEFLAQVRQADQSVSERL